MKHLTLNNQRKMPALGLGTYKLTGSDCYEIIRKALDIGYRHIDTAEAYQNEADIGHALMDAALDREHIFITTKIWPTHFRKKFVRLAVESSLRKLKTDYLDLLLLHWPSNSTPLHETMEGLAALVQQGKTRAIGTSNFAYDGLVEAAEKFGIPLCCCQMEYHALLKQPNLLQFADTTNVAAIAYSPLAQGLVCEDPLLNSLGRKYNKTAAQIGLRWLVQQDHVGAVPKASTHQRLIENIDIFDFELSSSEMAEIFAIPTAVRVVGDRTQLAKGLH